MDQNFLRFAATSPKEIIDKKHGLQKPAGYYDYWAEDQAFQKIGIPKASFYFNKKTILSSDYDDLQIVTLKLFNELSLLAISYTRSTV